MCIKWNTRGQRDQMKLWYQEHTAHSMVILKSTNMLMLATQQTTHQLHETMTISPCLQIVATQNILMSWCQLKLHYK